MKLCQLFENNNQLLFPNKDKFEKNEDRLESKRTRRAE